jgi:MFS family permease
LDNAMPRATLSGVRTGIARHLENKRSFEGLASRRSRRALDWVNFFVADVEEGFGGFVAFYLADLKWQQESVGLVLTASRIASAIFLLAGGALTDAVRWKRALVAAGIVMLAGAAVILALRPAFVSVLFAEALQGAAAGILTPAIAAISLGLVGRRAMSRRVGLNRRFNAAGSALTAALMGTLGSAFGKAAIFLTAAGLALPALVALRFVRKDEIDYDRARNAGKQDGRVTLQVFSVLFKNRQLLWFTCGVALFQLANASMLVIAVEGMGRANAAHSSLGTSAMILVPQIIVALLAPSVGYFSELWGRKPVLVISFAAQIVRAALLGFVDDPILLIAVQMLDGISGAVLTVMTTVIVADLTTGTGRFNLTSGVVGLVSAIAASVSTAAFGFVAQEVGHQAAFLAMASIAASGALVVWFLLGETKPERYID